MGGRKYDLRPAQRLEFCLAALGAGAEAEDGEGEQHAAHQQARAKTLEHQFGIPAGVEQGAHGFQRIGDRVIFGGGLNPTGKQAERDVGGR